MAQYYKNRPNATPQHANPGNHPAVTTEVLVLSEFDKVRETLLTKDAEEGWASELRRYLGDMDKDVTKGTDLVKWWQVCHFPSFCRKVTC